MLDLSSLNVEQTIVLNEVSNALKEDFHGLIEEFYEAVSKNWIWMLSSIMSRNPYQSEIFLNLCKLVLAVRYIQTHNKEKLVIRVSNPFIAEILKSYCNNTGNTLAQILLIKDRKKKSFHKLKDILKLIYKSWIHIRSSNQERRKNVESIKELILIDTFLLKNSVKEGRFKDRYFNGLISFLSNEEHKRIFFVPTILCGYNSKDLESISLNSHQNLLFKQDFLLLSDYLYTFKMLHQLKFPKAEFIFKGMDITSLLKKEFKQRQFDYSAFWGILNYLFFKRLKAKNVDVRTVIDWSENQPIDKGFVRGAREFYPSATIKGYQGYIISSDFNFYIQPTKLEVQEGVIPDEICVIGEALRKNVTRFYSKIETTVAPAFRFSSVHDNLEHKQTTKKVLTLVALPIGIKESYDILKILKEITIKLNSNEFGFVIKPHPLLKIDNLKKLKIWDKTYEVRYGEFAEVLQQCDILIGNTSTVLLESIVQGKPVVVVGSNGRLTQNPIPESTPKLLWNICYYTEEIHESLVTFRNSLLDLNKGRELERVGHEMREKLFEPITRKKVTKFLNLP